MFSKSFKTYLISFTIILSSPFAYATPAEEGIPRFESRADGLTLPAILQNGAAKITSLTQQINRVVVFNTTLKAEPSYVNSLLTQVGAVIDNTGIQINQIGKQPFDQISGGLTESDIKYITTDFYTGDQIAFEGRDGTEAENFIRNVKSRAFKLGKQKDNGWMAAFASICFAGNALRWFESLDDETQSDWKLLRSAILAKYPAGSVNSPPSPLQYVIP
ncbi:hypothetical protein FRC01_002781 [Tulasnella sp. 417]|nr:hypothetical protein FRC01_002781 [Tulasnella sp. 417]